MAATVTSLPGMGGVDYTVVLVPASAAADAGAFPQGSFVLPPGTVLSAPPALPPPHLGIDGGGGLPAPGDAYGGLGPLPSGAFGQSTAEADAEAFAAHGLLAPFGPEGADVYYGPLDTAQFADAAGLLPPLPQEAPPEEPLPLPPQQLLPLIRPRACPARRSCFTAAGADARRPQRYRDASLAPRQTTCAVRSEHACLRGPFAVARCASRADLLPSSPPRRRRSL